MPTLTASPVSGGTAAATPRRLARAHSGRLVLGRYDAAGTRRTLCARRGPQGSVLVLDEDPAMLDRRLVAHLSADEPAANAAIAARAYLADPNRGARPLGDLDWVLAPDPPSPVTPVDSEELVDPHGARYRIADVGGEGRRWTHRAPGARAARVVTVRRVVGALESYEPVLALTRAALRTPGEHIALRAELDTLLRAPTELNRLLRGAVLGRVARGDDTLSLIALRCGRRKAPGDRAGDTAWLRRRIGDAPEAGHARPTPWISCALLARIARDGLNLDPREVELA